MTCFDFLPTSTSLFRILIGFALILDLSVHPLGVDHFTQIAWTFLGDQTTSIVVVVLTTIDQTPVPILEQMSKSCFCHLHHCSLGIPPTIYSPVIFQKLTSRYRL
jgi:hypothetical protein